MCKTQKRKIIEFIVWVVGWTLVVIGLAAVAVNLFGCSVPVQQSEWDAINIGGGTLYQYNKTDGRAFLISPDAVIELGTPTEPTLDLKEREIGPTLRDKVEERRLQGEFKL